MSSVMNWRVEIGREKKEKGDAGKSTKKLLLLDDI